MVICYMHILRYAHVLKLLKYPSGHRLDKTTVSLFYIIFLSYILSTCCFSYCHLDFSDMCMFVIVSVPGFSVFVFFKYQPDTTRIQT